MRQLYLNQAALSAKATTVIRDAHNDSQYLLVGKWGLRADVLSVYTIAGDLEAEVRQESLGLLPRFRLIYHRQVVGHVNKTLGLIREVLFVRGLNWVIMGSLTSGRFRIYHGRDLIGTIAAVPPAGTTVAVTVDQPDHEALVICLAAILDRWGKQQAHQFNPLKSLNWAPNGTRTVAPFLTYNKKE